MDSPVIVDTASKFGRGIDLDRSFPGFPFDDDDDNFVRRSDIRAHLDDLAARHPEFADHLLGPPWGDIPFRGSTHNQRRGSGNGGSSYQGYPDEDTRSQASGSSAASAASGASGVSSHGEPETVHSDQQNRHSQREAKRNPIPQYGLRNTVDIGQHHRDNMENPERDSRGQRSMSAPPENRQQTTTQQASQEQDKPQPGQRFVSRVDITPQHNQQSKHQQPQSPPQQQAQSNVRHIPIFVEGRDEPVIPKNIDAPFQRQPSPPQFHTTPPHFQKSSPFNQRFGSRQWPPHFQDSFYQPQSTFDHSPTRRTQQPRQQQQYAERQRPEQPQRHQFETQQQEHQPRQRPQRQHEQEQKPPQQQHQPQEEAPKPAPKQTLPKDPLERVALVQKEVDSLAEQVKQYTGNSRKEKQYMYLDEMLTRELIKLDDIETEGRENVRQARKNAIRTIQETISLLESKAPLPGQKQSQEESQDMQVDQSQDNKEQEEQPSSEMMDVDQNTEQNAQTNEAIPLPAAPPSPTKQTSENNETAAVAETEPQNASTVDQFVKQEQENQPAENQEQQQPQEQTQPQEQEQQQLQQDAMMIDKESSEHTNSNEATIQSDTSTPMEVQDKMESVVEEKKDENQNVAQEIKTDNTEQKPTEEQKETSENKDKATTDKGHNQSSQTPKIAKKAKKQAAPISKEPIPLPPPQNTEASAK